MLAPRAATGHVTLPHESENKVSYTSDPLTSSNDTVQMMPSPRAATGFLILFLLLSSCAARPGLSTAGENPFNNDAAFSHLSTADLSTDADEQTFPCLQRAQRMLTLLLSATPGGS